jgi:hypothetical protein
MARAVIASATGLLQAPQHMLVLGLGLVEIFKAQAKYKARASTCFFYKSKSLRKTRQFVTVGGRMS